MVDQVRNIGPEGQRARLLYGLIGLGVGIVIAFGLFYFDLGRWWRLVLFLPFWQGGLGIFQALHKI